MNRSVLPRRLILNDEQLRVHSLYEAMKRQIVNGLDARVRFVQRTAESILSLLPGQYLELVRKTTRVTFSTSNDSAMLKVKLSAYTASGVLVDDPKHLGALPMSDLYDGLTVDLTLEEVLDLLRHIVYTTLNLEDVICFICGYHQPDSEESEKQTNHQEFGACHGVPINYPSHVNL